MSDQKIQCQRCKKILANRALYQSHIDQGCCDRLQQGLFHSCMYCDPSVKSFSESLLDLDFPQAEG